MSEARALACHVDSARHHELPHDDAKRVHIARLVEPPVLQSLRRGVERCSFVHAAGMRLVALQCTCEAEIRHLGGHAPVFDSCADLLLSHRGT